MNAPPVASKALATLILTLLPLCACMTLRTEQIKETATGIDAGDAIVVLEGSYHHGNATEHSFTDCVTQILSRGNNPLTLFSRQQFVDALYPWFEPRTVPADTQELRELLSEPQIAERLEDTGVRYVIWINGNTQRLHSGGKFSCTVGGPIGGGCFGFSWWQDDASYEASIWDLHRVVSTGRVTADVQGTSVLPALVVPIPLIARTKHTACKGLATQLRQFLIEES